MSPNGVHESSHALGFKRRRLRIDFSLKSVSRQRNPALEGENYRLLPETQRPQNEEFENMQQIADGAAGAVGGTRPLPLRLQRHLLAARGRCPQQPGRRGTWLGQTVAGIV